MKKDRAWLRAMKVWGQDGNDNHPVFRREGKRVRRKFDHLLPGNKATSRAVTLYAANILLTPAVLFA